MMSADARLLAWSRRAGIPADSMERILHGRRRRQGPAPLEVVPPGVEVAHCRVWHAVPGQPWVCPRCHRVVLRRRDEETAHGHP